MYSKLAEAADREDLPDDLNLPAEIARREDRIRLIKEAKERIKAREAERIAQEQAEHEEALSERERFEEANGRRFRRRAQRPSTKINPKSQVNLTDDDSRIMPSTDGFVQGYNGQIAVDCGSHLIIVADVSQRATDRTLLKPALQALDVLPIGRAKELLADAGYCSELNVERCVAAGITPYIALKRDRHHWGLEHWRRPKRPKSTAGELEQMHYRLRSAEGREIYAKRKSTVEPVFGNLKRSMGFRQFWLRGIEKVKGEWTLACMAWNVRRLHGLSGT